MNDITALVVVDVQNGIANATDGVPDAEHIKQAIGSVLDLARRYNQNCTRTQDEKHRLEILFVQHDDKDPDDPLYRGKATWNLVFSPQQDVATERLISKNVGRQKQVNDRCVFH